MKTILTFSLLVVLSLMAGMESHAQSPDLFNYQAIYRDVSGNPVVNTAVNVDISIRLNAIDGTIVYGESHNPTTNQYGLINIIIGNGATAQNMSDVDWSAGTYFMQVSINGTELSNTRLLSVPYSKYAGMAGNGVTTDQTNNWNAAYSWGNHALAGYSPLTNDFTRINDTIYYVDGNVGIGTKDPRSTLSVYGTTPNDSAIFEVKNNDGYTVFAVYNEGVRIYIDEQFAAKGPKGGFAIGGFDRSKAYGPVQEYLRVTGDSTRVYTNQNASKGPKGGFAIGGFDGTKASLYNYVNITPANVLLGQSAGENVDPYTWPYGTNNIMIGTSAAFSNTTGRHNVVIGREAAYNNSTGTVNVIIGDRAAYNSLTGNANIIIGEEAGYNNGASRNVFIGRSAGNANTSGDDNVYIGSFSGQTNSAGRHNTFLGVEAGDFSTTGSRNVYLGHRTGYFNSGSDNVVIGDLAGSNNELYSPNPEGTYQNNTFIGARAGYSTTEGDQNVFIGRYAGYSNTTGYGNVYIGNQAGQAATTANNQLIIANSSTTTPLIEGVFSPGTLANQELTVNGSLTVGYGTGGEDIILNGNANTTGDNLLELVFRENGSYRGALGWNTVDDNFFLYVGGNAIKASGGRLGINNRDPDISYAMDINGNIRVNSTVYSSDKRYKKEITAIDGSLDKVLKMEGVYYKWKKSEYPDIEFSEEQQIGFIAQDLDGIIPQVVSYDSEGFASVDYPKITAVLVEAVKEQQKIIDSLIERIEALEIKD